MSRVIWIVATAALLGSCSLSRETRSSTLNVLWSKVDPFDDLFGVEKQAALSADLMITPRGRSNDVRQLVAYERSNGRVSWQSGILGLCDPPILVGNTLYCPAARLYAFDFASGEPLWLTDLHESLDRVEGTADASRVYVGTSDFNGPRTEAFAADAATGQILWRRQFSGDGWSGARLRALTLSPEGDLLAAVVALFGPFGSHGNTAAVIALDPATGAERWRFQDDRPRSRGISGLTLFEDLVLYNAVSGGAEAVAFSRTTREVVWRAPWTPTFAGTLRAPQVADGVAYFADGAGTTFAVDARTGRRIWSTDRDGNARSLEVCGPVVLMNNGPVEVLDRATGRPRGRLLADDDTAGQMAVADNVVYVSAKSGVYAFDCTS